MMANGEPLAENFERRNVFVLKSQIVLMISQGIFSQYILTKIDSGYLQSSESAGMCTIFGSK